MIHCLKRHQMDPVLLFLFIITLDHKRETASVMSQGRSKLGRLAEACCWKQLWSKKVLVETVCKRLNVVQRQVQLFLWVRNIKCRNERWEIAQQFCRCGSEAKLHLQSYYKWKWVLYWMPYKQNKASPEWHLKLSFFLTCFW